MCELYLSEDAKEHIALLRENKCEGLVCEQSLICRAMSAVIYAADNSSDHDKKEMMQALFVMQQYNNLITKLAKEN